MKNVCEETTEGKSLREKMTDAMRLHGLSEGTRGCYLRAVEGLCKHYNRPPDKIEPEEVQGYLLYLSDVKGLKHSTCNTIVVGLRFFYQHVLGMKDVEWWLPMRKEPQKLPEVLSRVELGRLFEAVEQPKHRALLMTIYAGGLRVSEAVNLQVKDSSSRLSLRPFSSSPTTRAVSSASLLSSIPGTSNSTTTSTSTASSRRACSRSTAVRLGSPQAAGGYLSTRNSCSLCGPLPRSCLRTGQTHLPRQDCLAGDPCRICRSHAPGQWQEEGVGRRLPSPITGIDIALCPHCKKGTLHFVREIPSFPDFLTPIAPYTTEVYDTS